MPQVWKHTFEVGSGVVWFYRDRNVYLRIGLSGGGGGDSVVFPNDSSPLWVYADGSLVAQAQSWAAQHDWGATAHGHEIVVWTYEPWIGPRPELTPEETALLRAEEAAAEAARKNPPTPTTPPESVVSALPAGTFAERYATFKGITDRIAWLTGKYDWLQLAPEEVGGGWFIRYVSGTPPTTPGLGPEMWKIDDEEFVRAVVAEIGEPDDIIAWLKKNRPTREGLNGWLEFYVKKGAKYRDYCGYIHQLAVAQKPWKGAAPPAAAETELRRQWREFAANPDIVSALGLLPSSTIESFARVFSGWSYIDDEKAGPRPGDYAAVGLIIAGLAAAAIGTVMALLPTAAAATGPEALIAAATKSWESAAAATTQSAASAAASNTGKVIVASAKVAPAATGGIFKTMIGSVKANPLMAILALTQLDFVAWALGFSPQHTRQKIEQALKNANSNVWAMEDALKRKEWETAKTMLANARTELAVAKEGMDSWPVNLFASLGFTKEDMQKWFNTTTDTLNAYVAEFPQLGGIATTFPKEFTIDSAMVEDGDTLIWTGHPEAADRIRILGIDTKESETAAGKEQTDYLKSLIEGKQVRILTEQYGTPEKTIDIYGRLLGGVFLGDTDIAMAMLAKFGKEILTEKKYQKKYRWIDWDEYKRVAESATGPAVKGFRINITSEPSNAKLFIDGVAARHNTPSNEVELKDVMDMLQPGQHVFKATKAGKEGSVTETITAGANPDIHIELQAVGLEPVKAVPEAVPVAVPVAAPEEEPVTAPVEVTAEELKLSILSSPSRAKIYIDGAYTHHLTPSDEKELSDVPELITPGTHSIKVTKAGKAAEQEIEILPGYNEPVYLTLEVVGLARSKEDVKKELDAAEKLMEKLRAELAAL